MAEFLKKLLEMSIAASLLVPVVLLLRLVLKKAPKWVAVLLWGMVAVRLLCPFAAESEMSLVPSGDAMRQELWTAEPQKQADTSQLPVQPGVIQPWTPIETEQPVSWETVVMAVWITGVAAMLLYTGISYLALRRKVAAAVRVQPGIYQSEYVVSPFVLGILRPRIYLPFAMDDKDMSHVIAHEQAHLRRKDHWWKPLGFLLLSLHWFNPVLWVGYLFLCRDIELACDEKVISKMDKDAKADYTQALVACSVGRRRIAACPLAFGEVGVKERIKRVMHYKKPAFWIVLVAVVLCVAVAMCFLTDRPAAEEPTAEEPWKVGGKTYLYEKEGFLGDFFITLYEDGTFYYYEGMASSHLGLGDWKQEGDILVLTESEIELENRFRIEDEALVFLEEGSTNFIYMKVKDGEQFLFAQEVVDNGEGLIARSGEHSVPVLAVPAGEPVTEYANVVHWLTIDPGEAYVPFDLWENGQKVTGYYTAYDAVTGDKLQHFMPSGLDLHTYLFQNADPARKYIVLARFDMEADGPLYAFGAQFPQTQGGVDGPESVTVTRKMTLDDVRQLSRMGMDPVWESYAGFTGRDVGSGLYIMRYDIDEDFYVLVGGAEMTGKPMYAELCCAYTDATVDIRGGDLEAFIAQYGRGQQPAKSLGGAISAAIQEKQVGSALDTPSSAIHTHSYYILGTESASGTPLEGQTNHMEQTTVYLLYAYYRYSYTGGSLETTVAVNTTAVLTFAGNTETGYSLQEFWEPEPGEDYEQAIRSRFPEAIAKGIFAPVNDYYAADLRSKCLSQAETYLAQLGGESGNLCAWVWEQENEANPYFRFSFSVPYTRMTVSCGQGLLADMDSETNIPIAQALELDGRHSIYWSPAVEEGYLLDTNIWFILYDGEKEIYSGAIIITGRGDGDGAVYVARLKGDGLYLQSDPNSTGALIVPMPE